MSLPDVWRLSETNKLTVVDEDATVSYELVQTDTGEDRMPEMVNNKFISHGAGGMGYYSGWDILVQKDSEKDNRVPVVFRRGDHVEIVYADRTEIYRETFSYPRGSNGRIFEDFSESEYEDYYRNNGFRMVAP